jgi:hypothetical protein
LNDTFGAVLDAAALVMSLTALGIAIRDRFIIRRVYRNLDDE